MTYFFYFFLFLIGSMVGSFVGVVANRYNTGLSFWGGRSICFTCGTVIQNKDLFPIFSFLFLKGRCRHCKSKIPKEIFIIEILMGFLAVLASLKAGLNIEVFSIFSFFHFIIILAIFATILLISVYDLRHFIIPDTFLGWFLVLVILHNFLFFKPFLILQYLLAGVLVMLPFGLIFLISRGRWLGLGDVKYMLVIGLFLGLSIGFSAVIMAFWIGAGFSIFFIGFRYLKKYFNLPSWISNLTIKSEIPFGPFLSLGIIISFCLSIDLFQIQNLFNVF